MRGHVYSSAIEKLTQKYLTFIERSSSQQESKTESEERMIGKVLYELAQVTYLFVEIYDRIIDQQRR